MEESITEKIMSCTIIVGSICALILITCVTIVFVPKLFTRTNPETELALEERVSRIEELLYEDIDIDAEDKDANS